MNIDAFNKILDTAHREVDTNAVWFWMPLEERERILVRAYGKDWKRKKAADIKRYNIMMLRESR